MIFFSLSPAFRKASPIACLFIGGHWKLGLGSFVVFFFVLALFFLIAALLLFLKEIQLATKTLRGGSEFFDD